MKNSRNEIILKSEGPVTLIQNRRTYIEDEDGIQELDKFVITNSVTGYYYGLGDRWFAEDNFRMQVLINKRREKETV